MFLKKIGMLFLITGFFVFFCGLGMMFFMNIILLEYYFGKMNCDLGVLFVFDWLSMLFYGVVLFISSMIMFYSIDYMKSESKIVRYGYLMVGFVLSMGLVVFSCNMFVLLFGWDLLGLTSYCLVIFYQNVRSFNAGMLTILSNRVGDVGLIISLAILMGGGMLNYLVLTELSKVSVMALLFMVLACLTKSAQIPFSAWLPAAMAAPTPVSSLIHSSTLVAAGIYLLIRLECLLDSVSFFLFFIGTMTMFMAGVGANFEMDLSKVVALSTLSQLGMMLMVLSMGCWSLAYVHMVIHALFKAMMFMCVGVFIHGVGGYQDSRFMGSFMVGCPFVSLALVISNLSLMGFPFMSGFYSKDLILEYLEMGGVKSALGLLLLISFILTVLYSLKMLFLVLWGVNSMEFSFLCVGESKMMNISIGCLLVFPIVMGSMLIWVFLPMEFVGIVGSMEKLSGIFIVLVGSWMSIFLFQMVESIKCVFVKEFFGKMWFLSMLSSNNLVSFIMLSKKSIEGDVFWGELLGPMGVKKSFTGMTNNIMVFQFLSLKMFFSIFVLGLFYVSL